MLRARAGEDQKRGAYLLRLVGVVLVACGGSPTLEPASLPGPLVSRPAPELRRAALDGSVVSSASWHGHVAVVDFFAEHCVPCARVLPSIEALHRAMPDVVVLGISEDDDEDGARRMVQTHGLTFPVVHDAGHVLAGRFRVTELPATFVVDARGLVHWQGAGDAGGDVKAAVEGAR